ncbi:MAG: acetyl/propionyl-CoA carboxylase alpha subunit/acetyl-CoA carboxylase carboxyltransferase component [Paraglaciecola psychrophila]|jgi:acetyl/propionyl-CoA carboxylase alpha subunit/acetyl-CoA carboxylase carboxyltransferase component
MSITKLLIANRGEIAIRIAGAASELGIATVAIYSEDDHASLHTQKADQALPLQGRGVAAYLDGAQIVALARDNGCDGVHPGYGFLSENADFVRQCDAAGLVFVGPSAQTLDLFGDKASARALAQRCGVPVIDGSDGVSSLAQVKAFFATLGSDAAVMIKALAGGGGRGMRAVERAEDLDEAYARCQSEALQAFGNGDVFVERLIRRARHIEVQIVADGSGGIIHLGERECSVQRRNQKIIELAPCPDLSPLLREKITRAAILLAAEAQYTNIGTFEFLVDAEQMAVDPDNAYFAFIEANPRLQVEHTVTEEVWDVDIVQSQLRIAGGESLTDLGLDQSQFLVSRGFALQARINMEVMTSSGEAKPSGGIISAYEMPSGRGIRVDGFGYAGYATSPAYDSLLAKLIVHSPTSDVSTLLAKAYRALSEVRISGLETNISYLQALLQREELASSEIYTRFIDNQAQSLFEQAGAGQAAFYFPGTNSGAAVDPLAVLSQSRAPSAAGDDEQAAPAGMALVPAPLQGTIVELTVAAGEQVSVGQQLAIMDSMKMEHVITAPISGIVRDIRVSRDDAVYEGHTLLLIEAAQVQENQQQEVAALDLDAIRPDLQEVLTRHWYGQDEARPEAVAKRRKTLSRTARENIADLVDEGSYVEYGPLAIAAQRRRRSMEDLIRKTPGDGMVTGIGSVNGALFPDGPERQTQCVVMSYDYMVLAGTQGKLNHSKKDRMFEVAQKQKLPVILLTEGGGGRPGDTDATGVAGLDCMAFAYFAQLSGLVPLVGVNSGRCFAGNAALLGCCDVIIATKNSSIGMGGPAMIEGGGLGVYTPDEVGPMSIQVPNGVVDILVEDEAEAMRVAKKYLAYFQGPLTDWQCADQRVLRGLIPENRLRVYDVRTVVEGIADTDSVLELRGAYGVGMNTSLVRIEGRPVGVIANNPKHLGGAIDGPAADKASRFMQLCDAFDIPVLFLCDTPGFMVGPEIEKTAVVRRFGRMFVTAASMTVPFFTVILRKGYGLGAQAMAGGSFRSPVFTVTWPTGEFGGMGLEGAVKLGFRKELEAIDDLEERKKVYLEMVAASYERGKATNMASHLEIDDAIDPIDTRHWIMSALKSAPAPAPREGKKRNHVDTW